MATYFNLVLDTTAPSGATFAVNAGASYANVEDVVGNFHTDDIDTTGYQVKLWGDVDDAADESAAWVAYADSVPFQLVPGDGVKTVNARIRDDVGNETGILTAVIRLDTALPVPAITVAFIPTKISKVTGWEITTGAFAPNLDIQAWKIKVVPSTNSLHDAGTTIPTDHGSIDTSGGALAADANQPVTITGADLEAASAGDGAKIVKIFIQGLSGNWSVV